MFDDQTIFSDITNYISALSKKIAFRFSFFCQHVKYQLFNMLNIKRDINWHIVKSLTFILSNLNHFHPIVSHQRDANSSGWKFQLNNLASKALKLK